MPCVRVYLLKEGIVLVLAEIKNSPKVIGTKQVKKAINKGIAKKVFIAEDAEPHIIEPIKELCRQNQVEVSMVGNMDLLGNACGIEVGSATVALINNEP
jgi:large subunit ribosomal protein L7A